MTTKHSLAAKIAASYERRQKAFEEILACDLEVDLLFKELEKKNV